MQVDDGEKHAALMVGTRGSTLALRQAELCRDLLRQAHPALEVRIQVVQSRGDLEPERPLRAMDGTAPRGATAPRGYPVPRPGIFTAALEDRLLSGDINAAVHSAKDLPSRLAPGFTLAALPLRADPRDCLLTRDGLALADLPAGARIGTSSPRRAAQVLAARPDLRPAPIRGNVDTRRRAVLEGRFDAVVLAMAGLTRIGLLDAHVVPLPLDQFIPQAGQGALALETRAGDLRVNQWLSAIDDPGVRACLDAERAVLAGLAAGCQAPVAAHAQLLDGDLLQVRALVAGAVAPPGVKTPSKYPVLLRDEHIGPRGEAERIGLALAGRLRAQGADELLRWAREAQL